MDECDASLEAGLGETESRAAGESARATQGLATRAPVLRFSSEPREHSAPHSVAIFRVEYAAQKVIFIHWTVILERGHIGILSDETIQRQLLVQDSGKLLFGGGRGSPFE